MASEASWLSEDPVRALREVITGLARGASVEMNVQDLDHLDDSRGLLPAGTRVYVSHLPKQSFAQTLEVSAAVDAAGFEPVPHVPVRLLESPEALGRLVSDAVDAGVKELLLISGDYPHAQGPYATVAEVMQDIDLRAQGIERVSVGGHPEGHAKVPLEEIRHAELQKDRIATQQGLPVTFVTQFFFESQPFLQWARNLRSSGVSASVRAGLAGPARITTLLRFAARCGVGPSIRALGSRPGAFAKLLAEQGPEHLLVQLANEAIEQPLTFQGIHLFCFGGYLRTCRWLHTLTSGRFDLGPGAALTLHDA